MRNLSSAEVVIGALRVKKTAHLIYGYLLSCLLITDAETIICTVIFNVVKNKK